MMRDTTSTTKMKVSEKKKRQNFDLWRRKDRLISIEGVIGVGKTSLTKLLRDRWAAKAHFELFEENPFLTRGFYDDQERFGFNTEIFFLLSRYRQQENLRECTGLNLIDYMFEKNQIFAKMNLEGVDRDIYEITYNNFVKNTRKPDLVILLEADLETLLRRIYFRDREFERSMSPDYLERLSTEYYKFFSSYSDAPVLRISTSGLDFVKDANDFESIASKIEERLQGMVQLSLVNRTSTKLQSGLEEVSQEDLQEAHV